MKQYIHYGNSAYNPDLFKPIKNHMYFTKPIGGLWASDLNAQWGWKDWCEAEQFKDCAPENSFTFTLKEGANIITINSEESLRQLIIAPFKYDLYGIIAMGTIYPDFEAMVASGVDAVELSISEFPEAYTVLYGWDCDSIVVLNKDVIVV